MKKIMLLILFLLVTSICYADATAKILAVEKDAVNGSIIVKTQYCIDGVEVSSRYPQLDGKYYWVTRYSLQNFAGMSKAQILAYIKKDIKQFEQKLIQDKYMDINNSVFVTAGQDLVGATDTQSTVSVYVDTNQDNVLDTEWILKSDGTKTEQPYVPPTP